MPIWMLMLIYVIGVVVVLYLVTILPAQRKNKKVRAMHDAVKAGDEVTTIGGIIGTVLEREGDSVILLIDSKTGTTMRVVIFAVQSVIDSTPQEAK